MTARDWDKARRRSRPTAAPDPAPTAGAWTHVKRAPVWILSDAEKGALIAGRPDLQQPRSRARGSEGER